jgi:ABC-2 type transport system permease protein
MAQTDLQSQLDYQRRIEHFHTALRHYYYPFIFNDRPFGAAQFARTPQFQHVPAITSDFPLKTFVALALLSMLMLALGLRQAAGAEERR